MSKSAFKVNGQKELAAFFNAMPEKLRTGAARSGVTAAAAVFRKEARQQVQKKSGKLAKSIKSGRSRINRDGTVSIRVRLKGEHAFLGQFLEFGVAPHFIAADESSASVKVVNRARKRGEDETEFGGALLIGDNFISGGVHHPGFAPHPFMRPAFDAKQREALQAFGDKIRSYLKNKTGLTGPSIEVIDDD